MLCVAGPAGAADPQTARYQFYKTVALALVVAIPVGVPCALLALLLHARRHALRTAVAAGGGGGGGEAGASRETLAASEAPTAPGDNEAAAAGGDEDEAAAAAALAGGGGEQGGGGEWVYQRLHATGYGFAIADFTPGCLWCVVVAPCRPLETAPAAVCLCLLLARGWRAPRLQSLGIHQQPVPVPVASPELACP